MAWSGTNAVVSSSDREFESFFLEHFEHVVNSLTIITGDRDRATDATQEAFIKAYANWSKVRSYDVPVAWVRRIAINASRDSFRSERRRARREAAHTSLDSRTVADVGSDHDAVRLLASLPRRLREVATLFYVEDCSVEDIATTLRLHPGTVKSHLSDARERMRSLVQTQQVEP